MRRKSSSDVPGRERMRDPGEVDHGVAAGEPLGEPRTHVQDVVPRGAEQAAARTSCGLERGAAPRRISPAPRELPGTDERCRESGAGAGSPAGRAVGRRPDGGSRSRRPRTSALTDEAAAPGDRDDPRAHDSPSNSSHHAADRPAPASARTRRRRAARSSSGADLAHAAERRAPRAARSRSISSQIRSLAPIPLPSLLEVDEWVARPTMLHERLPADDRAAAGGGRPLERPVPHQMSSNRAYGEFSPIGG